MTIRAVCWPLRRRPLLLLLLVAAVLSIGTLGCRQQRMPGATPVSASSPTPEVKLEGEVVAPPPYRADILAPYRAPVARVRTSIGANVKKGDVLVELHNPSVQAMVERARAELRAAEAAYARAARQQAAKINAALRAVQEARKAEALARSALAADPNADPNTLARATAARQAAEEALAAAQAERESVLLPYRRRVEAARVALREAQASREALALVRTPISGTVLVLNAQPGQEVTPDPKRPIAVVVDLDRLQVHAPVETEQMALVRPGYPAVIQVRELPSQVFDGKVASVTTQPRRILPGVRYVAILSVRNRSGAVKPGMKAEVLVRPPARRAESNGPR